MDDSPLNQKDGQPTRDLSFRSTWQAPVHLYAKLLELETLEVAYKTIKNEQEGFDLDTRKQESVAVDPGALLQDLRDDLLARTYRPAAISRPDSSITSHEPTNLTPLRDRIVQVAVMIALESTYPADLSNHPKPENAVKWLAEAGGKGLTRIYSDTIEEGAHPENALPRLLAAAISQLGDHDFVSLLQRLVCETAQAGDVGRQVLAPVLTTIAMQRIDHMLEQVRSIGRRDGFLHATAARFENTLVILSDHEADYDWLLPAVRERVREELSRLQLTIDPAQTQRVDLERGEVLHLLDYDFRHVTDGRGRSRVDYKPQKKPRRRAVKGAGRELHAGRRFLGLGFVQRIWKGSRLGQVLNAVQAPFRLLTAIEVGWRHLPILLYPILAIMFGWLSPLAWLCAASIVVLNWRSMLTIARLGWQQPRRLATSAGALAVIISVYFLGSYVLSKRTEIPAPNLPAGFYIGHLEKNSYGNNTPVAYGLYVPPHFNRLAGPFPLVVYLHGYQERTEIAIFQMGMPRSIANHFGPKAVNGQFEFIAFFPLITQGNWDPSNPEVEDAMLALDDVIKRHDIDPARIYLTGHSMGGVGVWRLAEHYPDRWAALAPVNSILKPNAQKVRHIPAWIFYGGPDNLATLERERQLVRELKDANADVRYTELQNQSWHGTWQEVSDSKELYDWFGTKKKPQ